MIYLCINEKIYEAEFFYIISDFRIQIYDYWDMIKNILTKVCLQTQIYILFIIYLSLFFYCIFHYSIPTCLQKKKWNLTNENK